MRALAAVSLAVGIGLAAALAAIVEAILLRPLPVARPSEIGRVFTASETQPLGFVSYPDFLDFQKARPMIAECLIPVSAGDPPRIQLALAVSADYFEILGVRARFGRMLAESDGTVAVLAHGSAADLGRTLRVGAQLYTVIGVAPEHFGLDRFLHADLFIPIRSYGDGKILKDRSRRFLTVHVRGIDSGAELSAIAARLTEQHPETNRGRRAVVLSEIEARMRMDKMMVPLASLLGALAALILAVGGANACGALLLRADARRRDTAIKIALGATRLRLLLESLREASAISVISCALALPLAWIIMEILRKAVVLPTDFAISVDARIDGPVIGLAVAAALASTMICGMAPAFMNAKNSFRNLLAIGEIALAAALVSTGGSLWIGLRAAQNADLGYRADSIAVMTFDPAQAGYSETRTRAFYRDLLDRVRAIPGVTAASLAQSVPLGMTGAQRQIRIGDQEEMTVWMNIVTPEYFAQMHIAFLAGRTFDDREGAIVNEELARRIGIGERMKIGAKSVEVIGVVKTAKYMRWDEPPRPFFYLPFKHNYASRMTLHVASTERVFDAVRVLARDIPMSDARMLREYFDNGAMFAVKAALRIAELAGTAGLLLALAGLYGVVASSVERRRREIGIRVALGATPGTVFRMIVRQGMQVAAIGTAVGLIAAQCCSHLLPGIAAGSTVYAGAFIMAASLFACAVPALKALGVDPSSLLR